MEREKETPEDEKIRELEELIDNIMKQTCETEREKLKQDLQNAARREIFKTHD